MKKVVGMERRQLSWQRGVRVASFELVLPFLEQALQRKTLSLSGLQQRFRLPPRRLNLPDPVIPQLWLS